MAKNINVQGKTISLASDRDDEYVSLTDMVRGEEGTDHIRNWMRNRNTVEYLGIWEELNNENFKPVEFDRFKKEAGLNSFNLTPRKWVESTNAIGIISKSGRYGGTYAHKDIAFEFAAWISPMFKLLLIKEFQRLKEIESNEHNLQWDAKRMLSKTNYHLHTESIKNHIIPVSKLSKKMEWLEYAKEADMLNVAVFGCTAKEWKVANKTHARNGKNVRDFASINELIVMSNLESINSVLIQSGTEKGVRFRNLMAIAKDQLRVLDNNSQVGAIKKLNDGVYVNKNKTKLSKLNDSLKKGLNFNPKNQNQSNQKD